MHAQLQKHCNGPSSRELVVYKEGIVCAAHSPEYGRWYRAVLMDTLIVRSENGRMVEVCVCVCVCVCVHVCANCC